MFGPYYNNKNREEFVTYRDSVELYLEYVEECRVKETYKHENCTAECKKRGCGTVWSTDGLWKLSYNIR